MSRRTAMQRPPRLSILDASEVDDEAATCSARDSRVALAGLEMRPKARSGVSYIEDSDVVSSIDLEPESVTGFASRPSYVARGEIVTGETRTYTPSSRIPNLGLTREEPLVAPDFVEPVFQQTMVMPASSRASIPTRTPSVRPAYRSQMSPAALSSGERSVPPPPESWVESPWMMPSARGPAFVPPAPAREAKNVLQTIAIVGTGVLMLVIVFGAVLFARADNEERSMQFSTPHAAAAAQAVPPTVASTTLTAATTMQVITAPAVAPAAATKHVVTAATTAPTVIAPVGHPPVAVTPRVKDLPPRARVETPRPPAVKAEKPEATPKKTKEEESVEALLKKLGEEQLSR